jgi:hypothetical protein
MPLEFFPDYEGKAPYFLTHNQGLISRIRDCLTYDESYPNVTHAPNWEDAVNEIAETMNQIPIEASFHHVKDHQHNKVPYKTLSLESRLNVDADAKAGKNQYLHWKTQPKVPPMLCNSIVAELPLVPTIKPPSKL